MRPENSKFFSFLFSRLFGFAVVCGMYRNSEGTSTTERWKYRESDLYIWTIYKWHVARAKHVTGKDTVV